MITIATTQDNDLFLDAAGNLALARGDAAAMQTVRHAVLTNYGELPLNQTAGVPYFATVLTGRPDLEAFEQWVRLTAQSVDEVQSVNDFTLQQQGKTLKYSLQITLTNGSEVTVNG
ncbi:hypothetical protein [Candidatus Avelusimicrobium alvi]|uniref:hypothetical protein n=1 Tax=Candidatus Avelusimicrobium alvi TaxID=3416221 RepID=UPI003D0E9256